MHPLAISLLSLLPLALASPTGASPRDIITTTTVSLPTGTVKGVSILNVDSFYSIPFALPPTGPLRLKPPQPYPLAEETFIDATSLAASCPQMFFSTESENIILDILADVLTLPLFDTAGIIQEDCLTLKVQRPAGTQAGDNLPVLVWIFGGGFELGSEGMYDASGLIKNGVGMDMPFVFVAMNYRVGGFGFMPGKEILADGASNLGLLDQRLALEWVADNIASFGGDPDKVTLWGESAGAISILDQMALYGGDNTYKGSPLFRGAIMNSGSVTPTDPVDCPKGQVIYDMVVDRAGCSSAEDTLTCLRETDYQTFLDAANSVPGILSYSSVALSYLPRPDGSILQDSPEILIQTGRYASVPMIIGDQEDEGTLFALFQPNITNTDRLVSYLKTLFFHSASEEDLYSLVATYPRTLSTGSPFRTGIWNELYPGFKRLAAILGDLVFTLTRRSFLADAKMANPGTKAWSYLSSYNYGTPVLGTFHGSDLLQVFYGLLPNYASRNIQGYYFSFLYHLDPNAAGGQMEWPEWKDEDKELMWFFNDHAELLADDFRSESYDWIRGNFDILHV